MSNGFTVPYSSSPPSTPGSKQQSQRGNDSYMSFQNNPSTTPAGPPPSSSRSFTPAGPPPSSFLGSSQFGTGGSSFKPKLFDTTQQPPGYKNANGGFPRFMEMSNPPVSIPLNDQDEHSSSEEQMEEGDGDYEPEEDVEEHDEMEVDPVLTNKTHGTSHGKRSVNFDSSIPYDWGVHGNSTQGFTPRGVKRSRGGSFIGRSTKGSEGPVSTRNKESDLQVIAKDVAIREGNPELSEPDGLILDTEEFIRRLYQTATDGQDAEQFLEAALHVVPEALGKVWQSWCNKEKSARPAEEFDIGVGPSENAPRIHKATFLATLLLKIYHPPATSGLLSSSSRLTRGLNKSLSTIRISKSEAYPKVLLDWLEHHHNPYKHVLGQLNSFTPNPTANAEYWDIILAAVLRGKITEVIRILKDSDFKHARTAEEDGHTSGGYRGTQLENISRVINSAILVLESCPAVRDGDWHITGNDWILFRKRVERALSELSTFAEGRNYDRDLDNGASFQAENFGLKSTTLSMSRSTRKAKSKVPWTVYQNLKSLYGILLCAGPEAVNFAQDWVEATLFLSVWWDGDDEDALASTLADHQRSLRRSRGHNLRSVDVNPGSAYRHRVMDAFAHVTQEGTLTVDPNNAVEVGVASIFEGNVEGVLGLLRSWSLPITAAVIEIATLGGWYESAPGTGVVDGFNESDLMVLSYAQPNKGRSKDGVLSDYAELLFHRGTIVTEKAGQPREGWELAIRVLNRMDDASSSVKEIGAILTRLTVDDDDRADKLISLCRSHDLVQEACNVAERYAAKVAESTDHYGTALLYYARAHDAKKVKDVVDLLISFSLVQSAAYPAAADLDRHLAQLLNNKRDSLRALDRDDQEAARILSTRLSGYATLRRFYDLRDEEARGEGRVRLRPIARKKAAAAALVMVVASAANSIQGGLFDAATLAVVPVDGLLVLLGEASVLVDHTPRLLALPQILVLLRAVEDLQTVHPRILAQCGECLASTLASAHGAAGPPAAPSASRGPLKKSISEMTGSSAFSLVGSEMLGSGTSGGEDGANGGGGDAQGRRGRAKDRRSRGWDWRMGFGKDVRAEEVLRHMRAGLAKEVARAWMAGEELD